MKFDSVWYLIMSDLHRYPVDKKPFAKFCTCMLREPGFKYTFYMRLCKHLQGKGLMFPVYAFCRVFLRHYKYKFGIEIPFVCDIGPGLKIAHFGGILANPNTKIGKNCDIHPGVVFGRCGKIGDNTAPVLGDNVFISAGSKIIGPIKVGDNVVLGANCVVTSDVPSNSIIAGNPGKIVSKKGSWEFTENKVN